MVDTCACQDDLGSRRALTPSVATGAAREQILGLTRSILASSLYEGKKAQRSDLGMLEYLAHRSPQAF